MYRFYDYGLWVYGYLELLMGPPPVLVVLIAVVIR